MGGGGALRIRAQAVAGRPAFGRHGNKVVVALCSWEVLALLHVAPIPTLSQSVRKIPSLGWIILGLLAHHWYLEKVIDEVAKVASSTLPPAARVGVVRSMPSPLAGR